MIVTKSVAGIMSAIVTGMIEHGWTGYSGFHFVHPCWMGFDGCGPFQDRFLK